MYEKLFDNSTQEKMISYFYNDLAKLGTLKRFRKNEILNPDNADNIYIVVEGCFKQVLYSFDGNEKGFFRLTPGTIFGEMDYFDGHRTCVITKVLEDSAASIVSREILEEELKKNSDIYRYFLHSITRKYRLLMLQITDNLFNDSLGKLASVLLRIGAMQEGELKKRIIIDYIYTHQELASVMGCSRITITKSINYFKETGIISIKDKHIILEDTNKLNEYVNLVW